MILELPQRLKVAVRERVRTNRISFCLRLPDGSLRVVSPKFFHHRQRKGLDQKFPLETLDKAARRLAQLVMGPVDLAKLHIIKDVHELRSSATYKTVFIVAYEVPENFVPSDVGLKQEHLEDPLENPARRPSHNTALRAIAERVLEHFANISRQSAA